MRKKEKFYDVPTPLAITLTVIWITVIAMFAYAASTLPRIALIVVATIGFTVVPVPVAQLFFRLGKVNETGALKWADRAMDRLVAERWRDSPVQIEARTRTTRARGGDIIDL